MPAETRPDWRRLAAAGAHVAARDLRRAFAYAAGRTHAAARLRTLGHTTYTLLELYQFATQEG